MPSRIGIPYYSSNSSSNTSLDWSLFKPAAYYPPSLTLPLEPQNDMIESNSQTNQVPTISKENEVIMGLKVVSVRGDNPAKYGKPTVPATIMLLNSETGECSAVMGGTYLTAARTAAGSAIATELCLRRYSQHETLSIDHLVVFGAGLQGHAHIKALEKVALIRKVTLINRTLERMQTLKRELTNIAHVETLLLDQSEGIRAAVKRASVIVTATNSATPLFQGCWVPSGCHLVSVGSYTPDMQELDNTIVNRCQIIYDTPEALQVGDLKHLSPENSQNLIGLLGDIMADPTLMESHRSADLGCTLFKSVGTAIQDVITAQAVLKKARELGIGIEVQM